MTIKEVATVIRRIPKRKLPVIIAIEGVGGSGKTTLAEELRAILGNAYVVNIDDFIVKERLTEPSWDNGAFDRERLKRQVLVPASTGLPIAYEELLWDTNTLSEPKTVPEVEYVIVEGITAYHPDVAEYYDFKIWVDTQMTVAKKRGHAREGSNENADFWDLWEQNDLVYQRKYHPELEADAVVENA